MKYFVSSPDLGELEQRYIQNAVSTGWISSTGPNVAKFENEFANFVGVKHASTCSSGTTAFHLICKALGLSKNDEVIVPSFTMIGSVSGFAQEEVTIVPVDVDLDDWGIAPNEISRAVSSRTKAVMIVNIMGVFPKIHEIKQICNKHGLILIEDAAESHGSVYNGVQSGAIGDVAGFSFFANKNLTMGEGGAVVTSNDAIIDEVNYYKNMCFPLNGRRDYLHKNLGYNYRLTNMQASIGLAQLERRDSIFAAKNRIAHLYRENLGDIMIFQKYNNNDQAPVIWMNAMYSKKGTPALEFTQRLSRFGVDSRLLFQGMHIQPALKELINLEYDQKFMNTEFLTANGFYLPSSSVLSDLEVLEICDIVRKVNDSF